jgi:hypothetical protein
VKQGLHIFHVLVLPCPRLNFRYLVFFRHSDERYWRSFSRS